MIDRLINFETAADGTAVTWIIKFGYGLNDLIDVEHAIIVDFETTPART